MATTAALLADAEKQYHLLISGQQPKVYVDQNGERLEYTAASAPRLLAYITSLGGPTWATTSCLGPMRVFM